MSEQMDKTLKGIWDSLSDEQKEKAKACETAEELIELAGKEGVELSDEVLSAVAGGYIYKNVEKGECYIRTEWQTIDDDNGRVLKRCDDKGTAEEYAKKYKQSTDELSWEELVYLREHPKKKWYEC